MNVIDLLVTIIVVTILVTIALGVMTYIAYKLRMSRRPAAEDEGATGPRFFVVHEPPSPVTSAVEEHVAQA
jgi:Tfp pilus assembly protein PilE